MSKIEGEGGMSLQDNSKLLTTPSVLAQGTRQVNLEF